MTDDATAKLRRCETWSTRGTWATLLLLLAAAAALEIHLCVAGPATANSGAENLPAPEPTPKPTPAPTPKVSQWYPAPDVDTWESGVSFCKTKGARLATYEEICPNGAVFGGPKTGDQWVPYSADGENAWVQVGTHGESRTGTCKSHHALGYGRPSWGTQAGKQGPFEANYVLCTGTGTPGGKCPHECLRSTTSRVAIAELPLSAAVGSRCMSDLSPLSLPPSALAPLVHP